MNGHALRLTQLFRSSGAAFVLLLVFCGGASAGGFFINQQSVQGIGRVDAGNTAAADELGTIFFNPAGLTQIFADPTAGEWRFAYNILVIAPQSEVRNTDSTVATPGTLGLPVPLTGRNAKNPTAPSPIANIYVAKRVTDNAEIGFGANLPFGLSNYSDRSWFGRYDAIKSRLLTANFSLVGAYHWNRLSFGGGIDVQYASTKIVQALPDPLEPGGPSAASDGLAQETGQAWTVGYNLGALYSIDEDTRIGLHYRSMMRFALDGNATTTGLTGLLAVLNGKAGVNAGLNLPQIASIGARHDLHPVVLLAEFEWEGWHSFREIDSTLDNGMPLPPLIANYRNLWGVALGAEYAMPQMPWTVRGGLHYETTPTVNSFRDTIVPDSDRVWLGLGATWHWAPNWNLDIAFNHVFFAMTTIDLTRVIYPGTPLQSTAHINASVATSVDTLGFGIRYAL